MKLSAITVKTPLVKQFVARLAKSTKQAIPIVDLEKVKRVGGASVRPVLMVLENGQSVKIYIRAADDDTLDVIRIDINNKQIPMSGDYSIDYSPSFNASVDAIATTIKTGQKAFTAKMAKTKVKSTRKTGATSNPKNRVQQKNALLDQGKDLDTIIDQKTLEKNQLTEQLNQLTSG